MKHEATAQAKNGIGPPVGKGVARLLAGAEAGANEIRNANAEDRKKPEIRRPKPAVGVENIVPPG
jgi:hypothetical protein